MAGSSSPAAKRAALAPKTQRTPRKSAAAAAASSIPASHSTALASLADTLPDTLTFNDDEPTLGERVSGSSSSRGGGGAARNTHSLPNGTRKSSKAKLANGSASAHQDDDPEDDDEDEDSPNGVLTNGKSASNTRGAQPNGVSGEGEDDDDLTPFPLPASVSGNPLASSPALSHALNQALHSADKALLSSILAHSEPLLIRSTVQRLSGSQALLLLEQCVARLVGSTQGGGTTDVLSRGTSTGKVRTTVEWIRSILLLHTAYLMALPHLTTRLASLHMALSSRLASHNRLIGLQGRLDLVLSQIEMRSAYAAAAGKGAQGVRTRLANSNAGSAGGKKGKAVAAAAQDPTRWVEPSDDEDDDDEEEDDEQGMELDALKNDDDDEDGDEEDDDDDEEDDDEDDLELSPVLPAEELEDDSDIEDIMLGASPSRQRRRNQTILSDDDDDDDEGNTTADSGDEAHMAVTASTLRARALAERKKASAGAGAYEPVDDAVGSKRGKRGVGAAATEAAKKQQKKGKGDEMDVDDDDGEEGEEGDEDEDEDDESLLDEEGDSELEDDDEEDDEDHADYGMADMEAESTDGEEEEDETEEE
ncbi:hypothetical protein CF327_g2916 [Tilletia walkeri]|nr:hypothetical protein CF327_g2916 [Tilletia walkeri]